MILAHIMAVNRSQALEIVDLLMDKELLFQAAISEKTIYRRKTEGGKLISEHRTLIIGKTKGLLFNTINKELKKYFFVDMPMLYAVPIIYMDEELAQLLRENTAKV
jgi:uncharacterized protein involved in tolerance to divalent cations